MKYILNIFLVICFIVISNGLESPQIQQRALRNIKQDKQKLQQSIKQDYRSINVYLQPNQRHILTPGLLFNSDSSFKKQYSIYSSYGFQNKQSIKSGFISDISNQTLIEKPSDLLVHHPALQIITSYNLSENSQLTIKDCEQKQIFVNDQQDKSYFVCIKIQKEQVEVYLIQYLSLVQIYKFKLMQVYSRMNILSQKGMIFYNNSHMTYYLYEKQQNTTKNVSFIIKSKFQLQSCETHIQDNQQLISQLYQVCYTNNNQIKSTKTQTNDTILKQYVVLLLITNDSIILRDYFQIPNNDNATVNHYIGLQIVSGLQRIVMLCQNVYNLTYHLSNSSDLTFINSFCSIYKIFIEQSKMVLINRMQLQHSTYPLLQVSLQVKSMLTVTTQVSIAFYSLDILKEMFYFQQRITIPQPSEFNCYLYSLIALSFDSVSLTCVKATQSTVERISFVMVYDQVRGKFIPVADTFLDQQFFHTSQLIYQLNDQMMYVRTANQQYVTLKYVQDMIYLKIYQIQVDKPDDMTNYFNVYVIPAQYGKIYMDMTLPQVFEIVYDDQRTLELKNAFKGSNISSIKIQQDKSFLDNNLLIYQQVSNTISQKIAFYQYSLLVSIYIRQKCIRIIKLADNQFYRILEIEKNRVDPQNNVSLFTNQNDNESYFYYTQTCTKNQDVFACELTQINMLNNQINQQNDILRVESTQHHKVIDIEYIRNEDKFVYLYHTISSFNNSESFFYLNFVSSKSNEDLVCYQMTSLFNKIQTSKTLLVIRSILLQDQFIIYERQQLTKTFCSMSGIYYHLSSHNLQQNQWLDSTDILNMCISIQSKQFKYFIQQDSLIIVFKQSVKSDETYYIQKNIIIYKIYEDLFILKTGQYSLKEQIIKQKKQSDDFQYVGVYKDSIVMINCNTIKKYHMSLNLQLLYEFIFNPQYQQYSKNDQNIKLTAHQQIKYVQFLQKYLIIQFGSYYQLYNIGQNLISIQIEANNFNSKLQYNNLNQKLDQKSFNQKLEQNNVDMISGISNDLKNVIINDAFLMDGDNILIYQRNSIVITKYITNPKLTFGGYKMNHQIVQKDISLIIRPMVNYINPNININHKNQKQQIYQTILLKIYYSHYSISNVAESIKVLNVPEKAQNFLLKIQTNIFKGPVLQYYLSDTFDKEIVLKQHMEEIIIKNIQQVNQLVLSSANIIIEFNKPWYSGYSMLSNQTHLIISQHLQNQQLLTKFISLQKQLQDDVFLKFMIIQQNDKPNSIKKVQQKNYNKIITIISQHYFVFVSVSNQQYKFIGYVQHNITISLDNIQQKMEFQLIDCSQFYSKQKFTILVWNQEQQSQQFIQIFQIMISDSCVKLLDSFNRGLNSCVSIQPHQIIVDTFQIRSIKTTPSQSSQLFILTTAKTLLRYSYNLKQPQTIYLIQTINLRNHIPKQYRSFDSEYKKFQILQRINKNLQIQLSLLLFSQTDLAFHIEFQIQYTANRLINLKITNIYAGYQNLRLRRIVQIGIKSKSDDSHYLDINSQKFDSNQQISQGIQNFYSYFILEYSSQPLLDMIIVYYEHNDNFQENRQTGYLKCGYQLNDFSIKSKSNHNQKILNEIGRQNEKSCILVYVQILPYNQIYFQQVQIIQEQVDTQTLLELSILNQKKFHINQSVYMLFNYQQPPVVIYILLNARNFNLVTGIYAKFVFLKHIITWTGFYIGLVIFITSFTLLAIATKKCQPPDRKQDYYNINKTINQSEDLRSRLIERQERIICIQQQNQSNSSKDQISFKQIYQNESNSSKDQDQTPYSPYFKAQKPDQNQLLIQQIQTIDNKVQRYSSGRFNMNFKTNEINNFNEYCYDDSNDRKKRRYSIDSNSDKQPIQHIIKNINMKSMTQQNILFP